MSVERWTTNGVTVTAFPPSWLGFYAVPLAGQPDHVAPLHAAEVLANDPSVQAALDGPMFGKCSAGDYRTYTCADLDTLVHDPRTRLPNGSLGLFVASERSDGQTLSVLADGTARMNTGAQMVPGAVFAVQLYPALLQDGEILANNNGPRAERVWRAALGILRDGRIAFAIAQNSLVEFTQSLKDLGFISAAYTDGGGSTSSVVRGGTRMGSGEDRRVASFLVARDPSLVSRKIPWKPIAAVAVSLALIGTAAWLLQNRENQAA